MRTITVEEIIEHAEDFERHLTELYTKIAGETDVGAVRMLVDYMSRHRNRIEDALSKIPPEQMQRFLKVPLQYEPRLPGVYCFEAIKLTSDASPLEILDAANKFDEYMVLMYRQISQQPVCLEIKDFFGSLLQMEQNDQLELEEIKTMFVCNT